jgi:chemosensory pili system protein ChpA (sensor histidine kinase/response regulator)
VISSLEYYLERMLQDPDAAGERVLERATQSLAALGYLPAEKPWRQALVAPDGALSTEQAPSQSQFDALASPTSGLNPPALQRPGSLLPPPAGEEPIDDELREVFLEETDEVLDVLHRNLPNSADKTAQGEMRRAFHTLKGSGRMVRALVLAELAWAVENLLNRVLERSVALGADVQQVLDEAVAVLPELIADFAIDDQRQRDEVDALAARAHALASGAATTAGEPHDPMLMEIFRNEAQSHLDTGQ